MNQLVERLDTVNRMVGSVVRWFALAMMLLQFQMDTDREVRLPGVAEPRSEFADPAEPIRLALEQERRVTDQISAMANAARAESDYQAEQFMQWFLKEQVEKEAVDSRLLNPPPALPDQPPGSADLPHRTWRVRDPIPDHSGSRRPS